jgi:hypothetical protein
MTIVGITFASSVFAASHNTAAVERYKEASPRSGLRNALRVSGAGIIAAAVADLNGECAKLVGDSYAEFTTPRSCR